MTWVWGKNAGPWLQLNNAGFGIGAILRMHDLMSRCCGCERVLCSWSMCLFLLLSRIVALAVVLTAHLAAIVGLWLTGSWDALLDGSLTIASWLCAASRLQEL